MERLLLDLRFAARVLRKHRLSSAVAVIALALGTGVNAALFGFIDAVMLRPPALPNVARLLSLYEIDVRRGAARGMVSPGTFLDWKEQTKTLDAIGAFAPKDPVLAAANGPVPLAAEQVTAGFFETIAVSPLLGRTFHEDDERFEHRDVAVMAYTLWTRYFGSDPQIIGQSVVLDTRPTTIVGVMPEGFSFPQQTELWVPLHLDEGAYNMRFLSVIGRRRSLTAIDAVRAEITVLTKSTQFAPPGRAATVVPMTAVRNAGSAKPLAMLFGSVVLVLLIACAQVVNLRLAQAVDRSREIVIRRILGSTPARILQQLLTEGALLSVLGIGGGLLLYSLSMNLLKIWAALIFRGASTDIRLDARVLTFMALVGASTTCPFGLAPGLHLVKESLNVGVRTSGPTATGGGPRNQVASSVLLVVQVALSLVLLFGAVTLMKSLIVLQSVKPGFDASHVLTMRVSRRFGAYKSDEQRMSVGAELIRRVRELPGVAKVATASALPMQLSAQSASMTAVGAIPRGIDSAQVRLVSSDYFAATGIPVLEGRLFSDNRRRSVVVNSTLARIGWPNEDPVGKHLMIAGPPALDVIGVVGDVRDATLDADPRPQAYIEDFIGSPYLIVRTDGDPRQLAGSISDLIHSMDRFQPVENVRTMEDVVADSILRPSIATALSSGVACLALMLAVIGIYGAAMYSVKRRGQEVAIRLALGARRHQIVSAVLRRSLGAIGIGIAGGVVGMIVLSRLLTGLVFGIDPVDGRTFLEVCLLSFAVASLASYLPVARLLRSNVSISLRDE